MPNGATNNRTRGQLSREEVAQKANETFHGLEGLNRWDRRRILQRVERLNRLV